MRHDADVEKLLEGFSPRTPDSGRKERIIRAARQKISASRLLTPAWRWVLAAGLVLFLFFVLADWRVAAGERNLLHALLDLPGQITLSPEQRADEERAELLAYLPDLDAVSKIFLRRVYLDGERTAADSAKSYRGFMEGFNEY
jgi:hypothetical protein